MTPVKRGGPAATLIVRSAFLMGGLTMVSRVLGYVRDALNAALFGAGWVADAYFVAFRIPNMLRDLAGEGVLSAAVIPTLSRLDAQKGPGQSHRLVGALLTLAAALGGITVIAGILAAPLLVGAMAPGFIALPGKFALSVSLTRLMFPFIVFVSLAAIFQGLLNARSHFAAPALGPIALNVSIILAAVVFCPLAGVLPEKRIYVWTAGVLAGGAAQWLVQVPAARRMGFRYAMRLWHPAVRQVGSLMLPALIGLSVGQLHLLVNTILASLLPEGSVAHLYYGNRLQQLPLGVVGVALATASYPVVARALARNDPAAAAQAVNHGLRFAAFSVLPAAAGLIALAPHISGLLFCYGRFGPEDAAVTALVCRAYAIGIFGHACLRILTPPFYALGQPYQPVVVAGAGVACNILLSSLLMLRFGIVGLPVSTSLVTLVSALWLGMRLRRLLPEVGGWTVGSPLLLHLGMAVLMALATGWAAAAGAKWLSICEIPLKAQEALLAGGGVVLGIGIYLGLGLVLGSRELREALRARRERGA